ncbi:hypothetical protein L9F63_012861, partial [Diploptera punctata]
MFVYSGDVFPSDTRNASAEKDTECDTPRIRGSSNLVRSTSIPSLKLFSDGARLKPAQTPVTPRHSKPIKRFVSEANLHKPATTPDCYTNVHLETPRIKLEPDDEVISLREETSNLTVGVRVRPLNAKETAGSGVTSVVAVDGSEVKVMCDSGVEHSFTYDHCFWSCDPQHPQFGSQEVVFTTMMQPLIDKAFQGYNTSLFAYGQTGSGKSYSMMGPDVGQEVGIIPRFCQELFDRIASLDDSTVSCSRSVSESACVEVSYFEIYNEKIHDLLAEASDGGKRPPLKVREHPQLGPYVVDLSVHSVSSYKDIQSWLTIGNSQRATAATGMNEKSSRSHSIFSVVLTQTQEEMLNDEQHKLSRRSRVNLVDLAGSERLSQTCASGKRLREGVSINRSLLTLGKVIAALANNSNSKRKVFVPYRDSVLTWLLRESLGGNSRTAMLATISPANIHIDETLATLRYACQARTIVNRVRVNEDPHERLIRELRAEVERLRLVHDDHEKQEEVGSLHKRLIASNKLVAELTEELQKAKHEMQETEENLVSSKLNYEQQVKQLQDSLEQQRAALEEMQRYKSQLEIHEANQLCKQLNINIELQQNQHEGVMVHDLEKRRVLHWKTSTFFQWLQQLRDYTP